MALKKQFVKSRDKCKVTFQLPAEATNGGKEVRVVGDFNEWSWESGLSMKKKGNAYVAKKEFPIGRYYQYRYMIDGKEWENDWAADGYVDTPYGTENSVVSTSMEG